MPKFSAKEKPTMKEIRAFYEVAQTNFQLFPLLEQIMKFVVETSNSKTPLMTKIMVHLDQIGEEKPIVLLWATANLAESPLLRIEELKVENARLQNQLTDCLMKKN